MRKLILATITIIGIVNYLHAQENEFKYGTRLGLGESILNFEDLPNEKGKLAVAFGAASTYQFNKYIGLGADILFISKGGKRDGITTTSNVIGQTNTFSFEDSYKLFYIELPFTFSLRFPVTENLFIKGFSGPSMNFNITSLESRVYNNENFNEDNGYSNRTVDDLETVDYSIVYGLGAEVVKNGQIYFLDFRFNRALGVSGNIDGSEVENNYFLLSTGYLF